MSDRTDPSGIDHDDSTAVERQARDVARAERRAAMEADAPPVIPPCPSWCVTKASLHPLDFDDVGDGIYVRTHEAYCGDIVNVVAVERSDGHGGPVTFTEPQIRIYGADYDGVPVTPAQAVALGSDINRARTVLDRLTAPTTPPACPSWCARPAGHPYAGVAHKYNGSPVYERDHSAHPEGEVSVDVVTTEHYLRGKVDLDEPMVVFTDVEASRWFSTGLRELADETRATADLLDRITGAS